MNVSFGKYIPVKVFINGKEITNYSRYKVSKPVEEVTCLLTRCLMREKIYDREIDRNVAEGQRKYFASKIDDYTCPTQVPEKTTTFSPSYVKCANVNGRRYLVTGQDALDYRMGGADYGSTRTNMIQGAEMILAKEGKATSDRELKRQVDALVKKPLATANRERINRAEFMMTQYQRESECLHIYATAPENKSDTPELMEGFTAPTKSKKKEPRVIDKYKIDRIVFASDDTNRPY